MDRTVRKAPAESPEAAERWVIGLFAALVGSCIVLMAFFSPRHPFMEEVGVYNAIYAFVQDGKISFPIYGREYFQSFGIHPHTHYAVLGTLMRWGLSLYSAQALVNSTMALLAIFLIVQAKFPSTVKLGFLFGLYCTVVFAATHLSDHGFSVRPELHVTITWFAGLIALESGRLDQWNTAKLSLGTFLVTYASAMQNYAVLGFSGVLVYVVWLCYSLPWREALRKLALMLGAGCLVGIPFLVLYVVPNWSMIKFNINFGTTTSAPLPMKVARYFSVYVGYIVVLQQNLHATLFTVGPLLAGLWLRVPLFITATAVLAIHRSTRGFGLASLPVPLLIFWTLPKAQYFISEYVIYYSAFWITVLWLCGTIARWKVPQRHGLYITAAFATVLGAGALLGSPPLLEIKSLERMPLHEMEVARAAARQIVGPGALVASRHLCWYMSGGEKWYRIENDITEPAKIEDLDLKLYCSQFDAVADYALFSAQTNSGVTPSSMYADGTLRLRGFYVGQRLRHMSFLLFQAGRSSPVLGYYLKNDRLYKFSEQANGDLVLVTVIGALARPPSAANAEWVSANILELPGRDLGKGVSVLFLRRSEWVKAALELGRSFVVRDVVFGNVTSSAPDAVVKESLRSDPPIRFLRTPWDQRVTDFLGSTGQAAASPDSDTVGNAHGKPFMAYGSPIGFGRCRNSQCAPNAFDVNQSTTWASEQLGPYVSRVSFIGWDFGADRAEPVRHVRILQGPDAGNSIDSAILLTSGTGYNWDPVALLRLAGDGRSHEYSLPDAGGHRFWMLLANGNPRAQRAWQISRLAFWGDE
jgi:hypothetical protein